MSGLLTQPGMRDVASFAPRDPVKTQQGLVGETGVVSSAAVDRFGGTDSKVIRGGTVMARITDSGKWVPVLAADATATGALTSVTVTVGVTNIGRFVLGDAVKISKPGAGAIFSATEIAKTILSIYPLSGTFIVAALETAIAVGDYIFVEPATADGSADAIGVLAENVTLRTSDGVAADVPAKIVRAGFVQTSMLLGLSNRALITLAGQGLVSPLSHIICE